jgi:hypothetical protein
MGNNVLERKVIIQTDPMRTRRSLIPSPSSQLPRASLSSTKTGASVHSAGRCPISPTSSDARASTPSSAHGLLPLEHELPQHVRVLVLSSGRFDLLLDGGGDVVLGDIDLLGRVGKEVLHHDDWKRRQRSGCQRTFRQLRVASRGS